MEVLDIILLVTAYSALLISLFLQVVCYRKNIESLETVAFTVSLLLLIVAFTFTYVAEQADMTRGASAFLLVAMTLVGATTPLNILEERTHGMPGWTRPALLLVTGLLLLGVCIAAFTDHLHFLQIPVAAFLGIAVVASMLLIRFSRPKQQLAHREKQEQRMAGIFLVMIPLVLFIDYGTLLPGISLPGIVTQTGFTLPILFILLAGSKLWDDIHRLSLFRDKQTVDTRDLQNYGLTAREQEITHLLIQGKPYKEIAAALFISMPTVKTHVSNIYRKCKVGSRLELMSLLGK